MKQILLDTIHGSIEFDLDKLEDKIAYRLINTPEFQRLRRIKQQGFSYLTFHGAESSRFTHSIGVFYITRRVLDNLEIKHPKFIEKYKTSILLAGLLHDIGHGPFSHSSEIAFDNFQHENWSCELINNKNSGINKLLVKYDDRLPELITNILTGNIKEHKWTKEIVSGQIDCDRADYLLRDSYQTGTQYGNFQLDRFINSLDIVNYSGEYRLAVQDKSLTTIEDYLFARYSMYRQVYLHKTTISADMLFTSIIRRVKYLLENKKDLYVTQELKNWVEGNISLRDFVLVDDGAIIEHLKYWSLDSTDNILKDLSNRLLNRQLLQITKTSEEVSEIQNSLTEEEQDYYILTSEYSETPYNKHKSPILIVNRQNNIEELSKVSPVAQALSIQQNDYKSNYIAYPKEY